MIENTNNIQNMFPNIAGYEKIRDEGAQIVDIIQRRDDYYKVGARCPRGWFFYGDPGMGKTQLVKDISTYVNYPIIEISTSDAIRRKLSIDEDVVNGFAEAKKLGNCIVFIDEMDKFAGYKKYIYEISDNLKTQKILLHELDEIKKHDGIIVIATGNRKDYFDDVMLRSGRFDRHVMFHRPEANDREAIIKHFIKDTKLDENVLIDDLVKMTAGRSCAEIECMVNEAKIALVKNGDTSLKLYYFTLALNRIVLSDIPKDVAKSDEQQKLVAYHEIGHALMGYLLQPDNVHYVSIIPQGKAAGKTKLNGDDDIVKPVDFYMQTIKIALAGMASVKVMANTMISGNESDINKAWSIVSKMCNEGFYGLEYGSHVVVNNDAYGDHRYASFLTDGRAKKMLEILQKASDEVEKVLALHKDVIEELAVNLVEKKELSRQEIIKIIESKIGSGK